MLKVIVFCRVIKNNSKQLELTNELVLSFFSNYYFIKKYVREILIFIDDFQPVWKVGAD